MDSFYPHYLVDNYHLYLFIIFKYYISVVLCQRSRDSKIVFMRVVLTVLPSGLCVRRDAIFLNIGK